jgi:hypothetical protein
MNIHPEMWNNFLQDSHFLGTADEIIEATKDGGYYVVDNESLAQIALESTAGTDIHPVIVYMMCSHSFWAAISLAVVSHTKIVEHEVDVTFTRSSFNNEAFIPENVVKVKANNPRKFDYVLKSKVGVKEEKKKEEQQLSLF